MPNNSMLVVVILRVVNVVLLSVIRLSAIMLIFVNLSVKVIILLCRVSLC